MPAKPGSRERAFVAQGKSGEKAAMGVQNKMNLQTAPIRTYLDSTVVPVLLQARAARPRRARPPGAHPTRAAPASRSPRSPVFAGPLRPRQGEAAQPGRVPSHLPAAEQPAKGGRVKGVANGALGLAGAMVALAQMLEQGRGTAADPQRAQALYKEAGF